MGRPQDEPATAVAAPVDSGADLTVLPGGIPQAPGLPQVGEAAVRVAAGAEALLGRDVLNGWVVTLDGPAQVLRQLIQDVLDAVALSSEPPAA